jgi:hypothetical protein
MMVDCSKWSHVIRHPPTLRFIILRSEEVRRPLQSLIQLPHYKWRHKMETVLIVLVVLLLFGGGGWGYSRWRG